MFSLHIFYDLEGDEIYAYRDEEIEELSGSRIVGAGCSFPDWIRDVELEFATEEDMNAAKVRLQEAGFRFIR